MDIAPEVAADSRRNKLVALVEATSNERHWIWRDHAIQAERFRIPGPQRRVDWDRGQDGWGVEVGNDHGRTVFVSLIFSKLDGCWVGFWHPTSKVVNHDMIQAWLYAHTSTPDGKPVPQTDATNFHIALNQIPEPGKAAA